VCGVGVGSGVDKPVSVWRAAAEVAALLVGLGSHRGQDPESGALYLPLGLGAQQHHQRLVAGVVHVDGAVGLGQPDLGIVPLEDREQVPQLVAVEGPLILADFYRVEASAWLREGGQECACLGPVGPASSAGEAGVEELGLRSCRGR
jgi:hypothetical protein